MFSVNTRKSQPPKYNDDIRGRATQQNPLATHAKTQHNTRPQQRVNGNGTFTRLRSQTNVRTKRTPVHRSIKARSVCIK